MCLFLWVNIWTLDVHGEPLKGRNARLCVCGVWREANIEWSKYGKYRHKFLIPVIRRQIISDQPQTPKFSFMTFKHLFDIWTYERLIFLNIRTFDIWHLNICLKKVTAGAAACFYMEVPIKTLWKTPCHLACKRTLQTWLNSRADSM